MEHVIKRVTDNFEGRLEKLKIDLESHKDWKILERVLNLDDMDCFKLFRMTNYSLEDVESLESMLVNGLLDDSSLMVNIAQSGIFTHLYITWGNDDERRVDEKDLHKIIDLLEESRKFAEDNSEAIDKCDIDDRTVLKKYFNYTKQINDLMLGLASDKIKKEFNKRKNIKI